MGLMSKTEIMRRVIEGTDHETFVHETEGSFDVTLMRIKAKAAMAASLKENLKRAGTNQPLVAPAVELRRFGLHDGIEALIRQTRVVDEARIMELDTYSWKIDPPLVVEYATDGTEFQLLIDGTHRILRRFREGRGHFDAYVFKPSQITRPNMTNRVHSTVLGIDWGDAVVGGKIIKRT